MNTEKIKMKNIMGALIKVDEIVSIVIYPKKVYTRFKWLEALPKKTILFGLFKVRESFPEGFYESGRYEKDKWTCFGGFVSEATIIEDETLFISYFDRAVYMKPRIEIRLSNQDNVRKIFSTIEELNSFVNKLESSTASKFERITYNSK